MGHWALSLLLILSGIIGLLVGSFLAVVVLRLPKRQPIVLARSACPACGHVLRPMELVPVLSWLFQGRRCRACRSRISSFYPLMEIASAVVAVTAARWLPWPDFILGWFVGWIALCLIAWVVRMWWPFSRGANGDL